MEDVVPGLYESVKRDFDKAIAGNKQVERYLKKIRDGTATLDETSLFSRNLGDCLAEALKNNITQDILPDGRMYYNIADRIIRPMLTNNHDLTNEAAGQALKFADEAAGLNLNPISATLPAERINKIVSAVSEEGIEWEEVERRMDEPVRNISQSFMDAFIQANAAFRQKAGLQTMIVRTMVGRACKWCKSLAGSYEYGDTPKDVYRRHDNCRCTVALKTGRQQQDVWSKAWKESPEELEQRKTLGEILTKLTPSQAREKEAELIRQQEE